MENRDEAFRRYVEEDQRTLDVASELCSQLDITNFKPEHLEWVIFRAWSLRSLIGFSPRDFPSDQPVLRGNRILIRSGMDGKLTPDEWGPLLASSILFDKRFAFQRLIGIICLRIIPLVSIFAAYLWFWAIILPLVYSPPRTFGSNRNPVGLVIFFGAVGIYYFVSAIAAPYMKRIRLRADDKAADRLAVRSEFLRVLKKIDDFHLSDVDARKRFRGRFSMRPSITQRVENLQSSVLGTQSKV